MKNLIKIYENQAEKYNDFQKSLELLNILSEFDDIVKLNSDLIMQYNNFVESLILVLNLKLLLKNKDLLSRELELSKTQKNSNDLAAIADLLNKLKESIDKNKRKLKYLEEDYFLLKNKRNQISESIKEYQLEIQNLNAQKKECFSQINKIIRNAERSTNEKSTGLESNNGDKSSKSETIKKFQKQARDSQYKISQTETKLKEARLQFNDLNPNYEIYEKDYQNLLNTIKSDENRINTLKEELKEKSIDRKKVDFQEFDIKELASIRPSNEVETDIQNINNKLNAILESNLLLDREKPENLSRIIEELKKTESILTSNEKELNITKKKEEIIEYIENFRNFEILIEGLENLLNKFLIQINLTSKFQITVSDDNKNFLLRLSFIRSNKDTIIFEDLTTPEKIFFIISMDISIKTLQNSKIIVFSNIYTPKEYNKRGSIFRTIKKIIPVFETDKNLQKYYLIFIVSNLELKESIENLNVITIEDK